MALRWFPRLILAAIVTVGAFSMGTGTAQAGDPPLPRMSYYPYYYFPHSYWPAQSPKWPENPGSPYQPAPAYMSYPAFKEPGWRYELWTPMKYYRGHHFWLDQF